MNDWHPGLARTWGDGGGGDVLHRIGDIQFSTEPIYVVCAVDDKRLEARTSNALEVMWEIHRGNMPETLRARWVKGVLANDDEVSEFLKRVEDPRYASYFGSESVTPVDDGLEDAFILMTRLQNAGNDCTCVTDEVIVCPNFVDGDEDD